MCNAWNHPLDCTCGWGGDGHRGQRGFNSAPGASQIPDNRSIYFTHYASYLNPNATCPVCGAQVFFYQSPDGGRVFFDELGHPWPKHPCTDLSSRPIDVRINSHPVTETNQSAIQRNYSWQKNGWEPFFCISIDRVPPDYRVCRLYGYFNNSNATLYVPLSSLSTSALFQVKPDNKQVDVYQISIMQINAGIKSREITTLTTFAFLRMPDAYAYRKTLKPIHNASVVRKNTRPRSTTDSHIKNNGQSEHRREAKGRNVAKIPRPPTAIELAFTDAQKKTR